MPAVKYAAFSAPVCCLFCCNEQCVIEEGSHVFSKYIMSKRTQFLTDIWQILFLFDLIVKYCVAGYVGRNCIRSAARC